MKEKTCCFTGHRFIPYAYEMQVKTKLCDEIEALIKKGFEWFVCGGALGFDTLAATASLAMKKKYSHIKLKLMIPCKDQDSKWSAEQKMVYRYIMENADSVEVLNEKYVTGCMHERNRKMVDESSVCIAYLTKTTGGTAYTVNYALGRGVNVINIAEEL